MKRVPSTIFCASVCCLQHEGSGPKEPKAKVLPRHISSIAEGLDRHPLSWLWPLRRELMPVLPRALVRGELCSAARIAPLVQLRARGLGTLEQPSTLLSEERRVPAPGPVIASSKQAGHQHE